MPPIVGDMRKLKYPFKFPLALSTITPNVPIEDTTLQWGTTDNDEEVIITLTLSLNEFSSLANSIDVGRDIAYGRNSIYIWWLWVRSVNAMPFCEQVDNCLSTNPTTINILNQTLLSTGTVNPDTIDPTTPQMNYRFPPIQRQETVSTPPPACDKDALWAGILEIVKRLDTQGRDFYEISVAKVDKVERIASIVDLVPLFGDTIADVIVIFADVLPDLLNAYNAHSTQTQLEDTACKLFDMVCDECRYPTFDEVYTLYSEFGIVGIQDIAAYGVQAAIDYLIASNGLANAVIWWTTQSIQLYIMYLGGTFLNARGTKWLNIWADIGEDNPTNAWELLCDGCTPEWCYDLDFSTGNQFGTYALNGDQGVWLGNGWGDSNLGSGSASVATIRFNFPAAADITNVELWYTISGADFDNVHQIQTYELNKKSLPFGIGTHNPTLDFSSLATGLEFAMHDVQAPPSLLFSRMRIYGTGINPFPSNDC